MRIAPNELAFFTLQAFEDIHSSQASGLELFVKSDFNKRGEESGGLIYEDNPVVHRQLAKKLAPAFSIRSLKTMEPTIHQHIDFFVDKMKTQESSKDGVSLVNWVNWLTMDIAADMAYCQKMREQEEGNMISILEH